MANKRRSPFLLFENLRMALGTLRSHAYRSMLTILGVFIGVVIIIAVAAVLNGFHQNMVDRIEAFGTNNIYVSKMPAIQFSRPSLDVRRRKDLTLDDAWAIRDQCPAVSAVSPTLDENYWGDIKYGSREAQGIQVNGVFSAAQYVLGVNLAEGRFFSEEENRRRAAVAVIGHNVAESLFPSISGEGHSVTWNGIKFRVIGVLEQSKGGLFGGDAPDETMMILPYYTLKQFHPEADGHTIAVMARRGQLGEAMRQIEEVLRRRRRIAWDKPNDFDMSTAESIIATFDNIMSATLSVMVALSSVAFMVGGVGVMNIMLASVKERTREIGLRRALGARRRDITWQFLIEAMALTGFGGVAGVVAGEILMNGLKWLIPSLPMAVPLWARLFGFLGSVAVGLLFGLFPAISAARLDPIVALRYE